MAEVEVGGIKFRGGKIFVILTALTTAGGALWGGFEFYKDYLTMKEQIQEYVAPDLSEFDKNIALTKEEMDSKTDLIQTEVEILMSEMEMMMQEIRLVADVANELKIEEAPSTEEEKLNVLEINHVIFLPNLLEMIHQIGMLKKATMPLVNRIIPW